jgi:Protein of unknown function (DUF3443)
VRRLLMFAFIGSSVWLAGCGGGGGTPAGVSTGVSLSPGSAQAVSQGTSLSISATVANDTSNAGVKWSLSGVGSLSGQTTTSATYNAPATVTSNQLATVTATSNSNSSQTASFQITVLAPGSHSNIQAMAVDGGPAASSVGIYPNGAFTSVVVCEPGTSTCTTVSGILVDTGSFGLRVLASALSGISLTPFTSSGNTLNECVSFLDGSFLWGTVAPADLTIAGETASAAPVHVVADPNFTIPTTCSNGGTDEDNQSALGANGILGVGTEPFDCGIACDPSSGGTPPTPAYYYCSSSGGCSPTFVSCGSECGDSAANQQVTNPIILFATDNNGVILQFPGVINETAATLGGSMIFGIGTEVNNGLNGATVFTLNSSDNFTTSFQGQSLTSSFIDSGSNAYFFPTNSIQTCADFTSFYCPSSIQNLSATNQGATQGNNSVSFSIDNTDNLFNNNPSNAAFSTLGGPQPAPTFDWGLPFFYGRSVFTAIDGQSVSGQPTTPWWAY